MCGDNINNIIPSLPSVCVIVGLIYPFVPTYQSTRKTVHTMGEVDLPDTVCYP